MPTPIAFDPVLGNVLSLDPPLKGTRPAYRSRQEIEEMYRFAERVMHEEAAE
jgi:hypothetical protein